MRSSLRATIASTVLFGFSALPLSGSAAGLGRLLWTLETGG
jgi:hypothetical protein